MNKICYLKNVPFFKKFFGIVLGILGIATFLTGNIFFGLITLAIGTNLILTEGSEIDLENKTYRTVKSIFGVNFGKWKQCPKFEYVSVFKTKETQRVNVVTATTAFANEIILLNLFYDGNRNITFYKTEDKNDAFKVAEHFKLALDIDILDATENEKKWL
jgi:virulence-associated protein VapD